MTPDIFIFLAAATSVFVTIAVAAKVQSRHNREVTSRVAPLWKAAANTLGLTHKAKGEALQIFGERDGFHVKLERVAYSDDTRSYSAVLAIHGASWPEGLEISGGAPRFETGDPKFDGVVKIDAGFRDELRPILDSATRQRIHSALADQFVLEENRIIWMRDDPTRVDQIISSINDGLELARRLRRRGDDTARDLRQIVEKDPVVAVQLAALKLLGDAHAGTSEHLAAARSASRHSDPELRLQGAIALGADGVEVLIESLVKHPALDPKLRGRALEIAVRIDRARVLREKALLLELLTIGGDPAYAATDALAFTGPGDEQVEQALIAQLSGEDLRLRAAAATTLGQLGTIAAVAPLLELTEVLFANEVSRAAKNAIEMIQARAGGEKGALSLSDAGGELSLAKGESGGLSIAEE